MAEDSLLDELAAALPDLPRWVAPRALLREHRCDVLLGPEGKRGAGFLVLEHGGGEAFGVHRPVASLVEQLAGLPQPPGRVFVPLEGAEPWRALLPGWGEQAAVLHVHPIPESLPRAGPETRFLTLADVSELGELPVELASELEDALRRGPVSAAFADGRAVAFAHAAYQTERWFDLSLDTLPEHRRRGHATSAAAHLIHHHLAQGRRPVWGALDADLASMAMAKKYGFRAVDRMVLFLAPEGPGQSAAPGALGRPRAAGWLGAPPSARPGAQ